MRTRGTRIPLLLSVIIGGAAIATTSSSVVVAATVGTIDIPTHNHNSYDYDNNDNDVSSSHSAPQVVMPQEMTMERTLLRDPKTVIQKNKQRLQEVASALDDISVQHTLDDIAVRSLEDSIAANTALALVTEVEDSSIIELPLGESQSPPAESQSQFLRRAIETTTTTNNNNIDTLCAQHPIESCASHTVQYNHQTINCCTCTRAVPTVQTVCVVGLRKFTEVFDLCSMDCLGGVGDEEG